MKVNLTAQESFEFRHHGKSENELQAMLQTIGVTHLDQLIEETIPSQIRLKNPLNLPKAIRDGNHCALA